MGCGGNHKPPNSLAKSKAPDILQRILDLQLPLILSISYNTYFFSFYCRRVAIFADTSLSEHLTLIFC